MCFLKPGPWHLRAQPLGPRKARGLLSQVKARAKGTFKAPHESSWPKLFQKKSIQGLYGLLGFVHMRGFDHGAYEPCWYCTDIDIGADQQD